MEQAVIQAPHPTQRALSMVIMVGHILSFPIIPLATSLGKGHTATCLNQRRKYPENQWERPLQLRQSYATLKK
jgi:hypothetical protein